ncbi:TetR/AcrR family transcriptional regulator [Streptomyces sp. B1866]|uniref:TetR/AcrR family transcriptional regulator n=1 Tax=Streptomyces sp. B1866 TaxID=3075431 RepID=UPI002891F528|nr:TetR/AcrR family transcriptional regulator [Streptomyces sp. B1866]MDT3395751.1 TetR/AcrR family transcriptional regulator [Streptomyces sp. B1866]
MPEPTNRPERVISAQRRRRPTKTGAVLSRGLIVDTAIRLLGQHGTDALTVRRLGTALGADPSSLYRYFHSTDDLVLAIADTLIGRCVDGFRPTADWRESLRDLGHRIHATWLAHPQAAVLSTARVTGRPQEIRAVETVLGILLAAGFSPEQAARHYHSFIDLTLGFAALDAAYKALPRAAARADHDAWRSTYAALPAASQPHISACADALAATMAGSAYPAALGLFLDGLAGLLPGASRPAGGAPAE